MTTERLLKVSEVAERFRVSKMTVYRMIHDGSLPAIQIGRSYRVSTQAVDEFENASVIGREALDGQ